MKCFSYFAHFPKVTLRWSHSWHAHKPVFRPWPLLFQFLILIEFCVNVISFLLQSRVAFKIALFAAALALALAEELCDVHDERDERDMTVLKKAFEMLSSGFIS